MAEIPAAHYDSLAQHELAYWWHLSRVNWAEKIIRKACPDPTALEVLDFGCGTGGFLHLLKERLGFRSCMGVDASAQAVKRARRLGDHYRLIDPAGFRPPASTDLVLLMDVLEHVEDDEGFLAGLLECLKPGALVLISVPAFPGLYSEWDRGLGHYRRYTKTSMRTLADECAAAIRFSSYVFTYLAPVLLLRRVLMRPTSTEGGCDFPPLSNFLNRLLLAFNRVEMFCGDFLSYPFGASIFCLIERPSSGAKSVSG